MYKSHQNKLFFAWLWAGNHVDCFGVVVGLGQRTWVDIVFARSFVSVGFLLFPPKDFEAENNCGFGG